MTSPRRWARSALIDRCRHRHHSRTPLVVCGTGEVAREAAPVPPHRPHCGSRHPHLMTQAVSTARRPATWDGRAVRRFSAPASSPAFAAFARAADALVADPHAVAERLRALLALD